jgi:hypothetical protein
MISVLLEHGSPTVSLEIEGKPKRVIVDTGSNVSILQPGVSQSGVNVTSIKPYGVTGEALNIRSQQHVSFVLGGQKLDHSFLVCPLPTEVDGLLGTDFLDRTGAEMNFACGKLSLAGNCKTSPACNGMSADRAALTLFPEHQMGRKRQVAHPAEPHLDKQPLGNPFSTQTTQWSRSWLLRATENITLAPRCRQVVTARIESGKGLKSSLAGLCGT